MVSLERRSLLKKLIALILALITFASLSIPATAVPLEEAEEMSILDIVISGYSCAGSVDSQRKVTDKVVYVTNIVPLYDLDDAIAAYYVVFSSDCYAVVANNVHNPAVIEFGNGTNQMIEDLLTKDSSSKLIYNNPLSVYNESYLKSLSESEASKLMDIHDFYPELAEKNEALSSQLNEYKNTVLQSGAFYQTKGDGDFGFFDPAEMPTGDYNSDTIYRATTVDWARCRDYADIASNHCGVVAITNLALYFVRTGKTRLKINNSKRDTFIAVHQITGSGASATIASDAVSYFSSRGYTLKHSNVKNISALKNAISSDRPCGILLADGLVSWHWVIGVGWREYTSSNDFYIRINDGWHNTVNKYYKPGTGSLWWSARAYRVTN